MKNGCDFVVDSELQVECDKSYDKGLKQFAYVFNKEDIVSYVRSSTNYNEITDITLAEGAKAYRLDDFRTTPYDGSTKGLGDGALKARTTKTLQFLYYAKGAAASRIIDAFKTNKFVMVMASQNTDMTDNCAFEIFGLESALTCTAYEQNLASGDFDNTYLVTMSCTEQSDGLFLKPSNASTYEAVKKYLDDMLA